jgi:predicted site-specific integrase-resolvase
LLRLGQFARAVHHPARTVRHWCAMGRIPAERTPGGHYRLSPDLISLVAAGAYPLPYSGRNVGRAV